MHDPANELPRNPIPRTSVNKGNKEGRRCYSPALDNSLLGPPTCRGLPPSPARHRCGGAPSSIPAFTPVDVRHPPIDVYQLVSDLRLATFGAHGVCGIVTHGNHYLLIHPPLMI